MRYLFLAILLAVLYWLLDISRPYIGILFKNQKQGIPIRLQLKTLLAKLIK